ncbi:Hypothetical predicted protein [Paramuricea clavata]|uniref:Uncharacterized protein n=1 Tax=Paramuricea clavata TaxID=317549 RepID=A0A6S7HQQ0_PARCT|nr:Hypothetical predicted protein [Paramuricea clavata]
MTSIVTSMISSTVGLLCDKARDSTAAKLKDGDITDAKIREIVVRELDDIKTKLDGLSPLEQKAVKNPIRENRGETSRVLSGVECGILNEALELSHAMGRMTINLGKQLEAAKQRFKYARIKSNRCFL